MLYTIHESYITVPGRTKPDKDCEKFVGRHEFCEHFGHQHMSCKIHVMLCWALKMFFFVRKKGNDFRAFGLQPLWRDIQHSAKLTCNFEISNLRRNIIFQTFIFLGWFGRWFSRVYLCFALRFSDQSSAVSSLWLLRHHGTFCLAWEEDITKRCSAKNYGTTRSVDVDTEKDQGAHHFFWYPFLTKY